MAVHDLEIDVLSEQELEAAIGLSTAAGWNQLPADWLRIQKLEPQGCFAACADRRLIGVVTSTVYPGELAWIGMMLVDEAYRRRGAGRALMERVLEYLSSSECVKLDATPLGRPLYEKLGFKAEWEFHRWRRPGADAETTIEPTPFEPLSSNLLAHDQAVFRANRSVLLERLRDESRYAQIGQDEFGMLRSGRIAAYLGPLVARSTVNAETLLERLLEGVTGPVFWDIPGPNAPAIALAEKLNFEPVRDLTRMKLGDMRDEPLLDQQFALAGPEVG